MKFTIVFISFALLLIGLSDVSADAVDAGEGPVLRRFRRFTCDALSFEAGSVKVNHAACAIHCAALHYRGGYCNAQAVCVCRR